MSTATAPPPHSEQESPPTSHFDPDSYRMTVGEHLEELRTRMIYALLGLGIAIFAFLAFAPRVLSFLCVPLVKQLKRHHINSQLHYHDLPEPFMIYLKVTLICGIAIAGPWIIYQLWLFVAAGLYPHERKTITRYIPLSITLFITGLVFVYVLVLPISIEFFLDFSSGLPLPTVLQDSQRLDNVTPFKVTIYDHDPRVPQEGDMWVNRTESRLKICVGGLVNVIPFGPDTLVAPQIKLGDYVDLVLTFMLTFGVAFQLPLVILALVSIGIVEVAWLRKQRKIVYFAMTIASAFLAPGDIVASMLALLIPLIILYEFGILLVATRQKRASANAEQ